MHRDLPWYQDTGDTLAGVPMAAWETVEAVGMLFGFHSWHEAGNVWKGMYRVGENVVVLGLGSGITGDERTAAAQKEMELLGQDLIRFEQWEGDHPGHALGGNLFDVATLFVGGGLVKAGIKAGTRRSNGADSHAPSRLGAGGLPPPRSGEAVSPPGTTQSAGTRSPDWKDKARSSLDELGRQLLPGKQGPAPAVAGGSLPHSERTPDASDDGIRSEFSSQAERI